MKTARVALLMLFVLFLAPLVAADNLDFSELYIQGVLGSKFSPQVLAAKGHSVSISGYMAPPLRVKGNFFVLTKQPVSLCPFCQSDADWPADIIVIYLEKSQVFLPNGSPIIVTGKLQVGSYTDPDTGFVSQLRLVGASYQNF